jgi:hypothetical protein
LFVRAFGTNWEETTTIFLFSLEKKKAIGRKKPTSIGRNKAQIQYYHSGPFQSSLSERKYIYCTLFFGEKWPFELGSRVCIPLTKKKLI